MELIIIALIAVEVVIVSFKIGLLEAYPVSYKFSYCRPSSETALNYGTWRSVLIHTLTRKSNLPHIREKPEKWNIAAHYALYITTQAIYLFTCTICSETVDIINHQVIVTGLERVSWVCIFIFPLVCDEKKKRI